MEEERRWRKTSINDKMEEEDRQKIIQEAVNQAYSEGYRDGCKDSLKEEYTHLCDECGSPEVYADGKKKLCKKCYEENT